MRHEQAESKSADTVPAQPTVTITKSPEPKGQLEPGGRR